MPETKHTMEEAVEIQKAFESRFGTSSGIVGVGLCLNKRKDDLAINVYVGRRMGAPSLPEAFGGLDVVIDEVDEFKPLTASKTRP